MPMFWDAYIGDTTHLTTEEHGAYLLLLGAMWRRNGYVPNDDRDLARIVGLTIGRWTKTKARLSSLLIITSDTITQKNLLKIWKITQEKIETNRENGKLGGRPKVNVANGLPKANGSVSHNPNDNRNLTIPETEPETEPETKKKEDTYVSLSDPAFDLFNEFAARAGWPTCQTRSKSRISSVNARIKEAGGLDGWRVALEKAEASDFLNGRTAKPFTATIDFILQKQSFTRLMEGNYDNRTHNNGTGRPGVHDGLLQAASAVARGERSRFE